MRITRHFVDIGPRRVHYRCCGSGPALLMVHQSPRSSAEYEPLMHAWSAHFTCIAPDTPGFGQSQPLRDCDATIDDLADATLALLDALGLEQVAGYGFHSGAIILMAALRRAPQRFTAIAAGGYAIWKPDEQALFSASYLPPFRPSAYGEHLTWLWNRVLEQSWFFPWFATEPGSRLSVAHDDPARVDATVRDLIESGDAYRVGYGAVLAAPRDIPPPDAVTPPVLITAYDGDPLQPHLDRLGRLPASWCAHPVDTPAAHQAASLAFLRDHRAPNPARLAQVADEGFVPVSAGGFDGMIHWRGRRGAPLTCHAPGRSLALDAAALAIDLPGHGLSDPWPAEPPTGWAAWDAVIRATANALGAAAVEHALLPQGDPERLFPDLAPDRFGGYLTRAWSIVRAAHLFDPWYQADAAHARTFDPAELDPGALAAEHRALLQAGAARAYLVARRCAKGDD